MIKDFMKAFALVSMLFIGMISFTGFGNTTPDLTKNSETVMADLAAPVSVGIQVPIVAQNYEAFEIVASENDSFTINKQEPFLSQAKVNVTENPYYEDGGGGELDCADNDNRPPNDQENYRSPRDGIRCNVAYLI